MSREKGILFLGRNLLSFCFLTLPSPFRWADSAFQALKASQFGGCVINISATLHYAATWYQVHAMAAKSANDAMSRGLALEWGEYGIRVNTIAPGPIEGVGKTSGQVA